MTPDPSASIAQNLVLQGRTLDVIRAVTRDEAGKLKEAGERQREKADKLALEKANAKKTGKKKPLSINIPLHGPRVEIVLAWLGAVHLTELDTVA